MKVEAPIVCAGNWLDMGQAQGTALAPRVRGAYEVLDKVEAFTLHRPWWLPFRLYRAFAAGKARKHLAQAFDAQTPGLADRLEGIARGSGLSAASVYLFHYLEVAMAMVEKEVPGFGCSAVAVRGSRSARGEPILVHNFDYLPLVQPFYALRASRPQGQLRSLDFLVAPMCGTVDGINEHGLAIVYNYAQTFDHQDAAPTLSMRIAETLASCASVGQAIDFLTSRPRWGSGLLLLADAAGEIAALEITSTRHEVRGPDNDILFNVNRFQCGHTHEVEVSDEAVYGARAPSPLRGKRVLGSSHERQARFRELLPATGQFDEGKLAALMADHGPAGQPGESTICMHSGYWTTTACLQLLPCSRTLRVAYDTACAASYSEFSL
ncbi:MAG: C45 family autoproteolytic acyltransferase/hydrolase [Gemmataceae bacterium]